MVHEKQDPESMSGICFYGDCWGFTAAVHREPEAVFESLQKLHGYVDALLKQAPELRHRLFVLSDSIFLASKLTKSAAENCAILNSLLWTVENLCAEAYVLDLPIKGAVGIGSLFIQDNSLVGTAVIDAVALGNDLRIPMPIIARHSLKRGVDDTLFLEETLNEHKRHRGLGCFSRFIDIPLKSGGIILGQPLLDDERAIDTAWAWCERATAANLESRMPHAPSAGVLRQMLEVLRAWKQADEDAL